MDGVLADFHEGVWNHLEKRVSVITRFPKPKPEDVLEFYAEDLYDDPWFKKVVREIQRSEGFFKNLPPINGAIDALHEIEKEFEVFICTAPLLENPTCTNEKLAWVDEHLGGDWIRRTIITKDKTIVDADFLIDDKPLITGANESPIWQRLIFDQPYNKNTVGRRINWENYKEVLDKLW
jgi:5'-nucleotidase